MVIEPVCAAVLVRWLRKKCVDSRLAQLKKALSRGLFLFWSEHVLMFGLLLT